MMDFDRSAKKWEQKKESERKAARLQKAKNDRQLALQKKEEAEREQKRLAFEEERRRKEGPLLWPAVA